MWIQKTNEERKNENIMKERSARKSGFYSALSSSFIYFLVSKFNVTKIRLGGNSLLGQTMTWNDILNLLSGMLFISLLFGLSTYFLARKFRKVSTLICDSCGKIKRFDKIKDCDCAGHFVSLDDMKWVEHEETHKDE